MQLCQNVYEHCSDKFAKIFRVLKFVLFLSVLTAFQVSIEILNKTRQDKQGPLANFNRYSDSLYLKYLPVIPVI